MGRYLPQLDGLRAIAVLLVVGTHTGLIPAGYVGVDIFFVLSGYLITSILLNERELGRWSVRAFYGRRMRRLYPALIFMLLLTLPFDVILISGTQTHRFLAIAAAATYLGDLGAAIHPGWMGGMTHTWSLGVEEQFYLLWPFALPFVVARRGRLVLAAVTAGMLLALCAAPSGAMVLPFTRGGILLLGCLLALALRDRSCPAPNLVAALAIGVLAAVLASAPTANGGAAVIAGLAGVALVAALSGDGRVSQWFASGVLVWVGRRSYGIYLWHVPIVTLVMFITHARTLYPSPSGVAITIVASVVLAALSYELVERNRLPAMRRLASQTAER